jgi:predicted transcriptional regulator
MAGNGKSTAAEVAARVDTVMTHLLRGKNRPFIIQYATETWSISERMADTYIARATKLIQEVTQPRKEYEFALTRQRLEDLFEKTLNDKNYQTALAVLKQVAEITGINAPVKSDNTGDLTVIIKYEDTPHA